MNLIEQSLAFRGELRKLFLGWFSPCTLEREAARTILNATLRDRWAIQDTAVYELVFEEWNEPALQESPNYLVFIDAELDVDWLYDGNLANDRTENVTQAEAAGARRCKHLPLEQVLEFKRLIGHAVVSGIRGSRESSQQLAKEAAKFLKERTVERSRAWTLMSAHLFLLVLVSVLISLPLCLGFISSPSVIAFGLWLGSFGGLLGAYLSVVQKAGSGEWDAASGIGIHRIEVFTKLLAGTMLGGISFAVAHSVHAPPSIAAISPDSYSQFLFGFAAGLIERLIPKMLTSFSKKDSNAD